MAGLGAAPAHPVGAGDLPDPALALSAHVQMLLQQQAMQLARVDLKAHLELTMRQSTRILALKPGQRPLKPLPRPGEAVARRRLTGRAAHVTLGIACPTAIRPPARQDFIARRVTCTTTGVEIGDHVATSGGRRRY